MIDFSQAKLATSPSHSILTPGQPFLVLTSKPNAAGKLHCIASFSMLLLFFFLEINYSFIYLSVCLFIYLSVYLFIYLFIHQSIHSFIYYLFVCLLIHTFIYLFIYLFIHYIFKKARASCSGGGRRQHHTVEAVLERGNDYVWYRRGHARC